MNTKRYSLKFNFTSSQKEGGQEASLPLSSAIMVADHQTLSLPTYRLRITKPYRFSL